MMLLMRQTPFRNVTTLKTYALKTDLIQFKSANSLKKNNSPRVFAQYLTIKSNYSTKPIVSSNDFKYKPNICVVGSGPAALYATQYILKSLSNIEKSIDVYEKLPVPFGLVRYGVAPDHQDVKNVMHSFTETLRNQNVNFFGNVNIGSDISINELLNAYNCVVLAYGSLSEKYLNIPGEKDFDNFISAKDFVSWYNGLPQTENFKINLNAKKAIIIGAGNVSIDVARILLSPIQKLETTDMSIKVLEFIKNNNKIEEVSIVARRGVLNAAFTIKELRELTKIESIDCQIDYKQFEDIHIDKILNKLARPRKRITEFMYSLAKKPKTNDSNKKILKLEFLKTPIEILGEKSPNSSQVNGVKFKNSVYDFDFTDPNIKLDNEDALNSIPVKEASNQQPEIMNADLVIRSIGFKNVSIDKDIPFDKKSGVVVNQAGKVIGKEGLYCTGWIKRGPRGVIVDTTTDAHETAITLCSDLVNSGLDTTKQTEGANLVKKLLNERNVKYVDKDAWKRIDEEEIRRGKSSGKPREKFQTVDEMLKVAFEQ